MKRLTDEKLEKKDMSLIDAREEVTEERLLKRESKWTFHLHNVQAFITANQLELTFS